MAIIELANDTTINDLNEIYQTYKHLIKNIQLED